MKTCPHESLYTNVHNSIIIHSKQSNKQLKSQSTMNVKIKSGWRRLLRVPWRARRSNQSILKETSPEYSLEGLMLKLKFQHFGHLMQRTNSLEKTLMPEKLEGRSRRGRQKMRWRDGIPDGMASLTGWTWVWASSRSWWWTGKPGVLQSMGSQRVQHNWATEMNYIWNLKASCYMEEASYKRPHIVWLHLYKLPRTVKFI